LTNTHNVNDIKVNENIFAKRVILIDENGSKMGEFLTKDALSIADERGFDLIEVSNTGGIVVCKLGDYGKMKYAMKKKESSSRKNQVQQQLKEIKIRPLTSDHDLNIKAQSVRKFLSQGNKVKISVQFQGREISHRHVGYDQCDKISKMVEDLGLVEQDPMIEGKVMYMILSPLTSKKSS